jgi:hypothetical protein
MTHAASSPVTRETNALYRRRPLVATITAHMLVMREKGRRDRVEIPLEHNLLGDTAHGFDTKPMPPIKALPAGKDDE